MRLYIACIALLFSLAPIAKALDDGTESLRGLSGVYVTMENFTPATEQAGLTKGDVLTDVELKLRLAGIPVLNEKQWLDTPGAPYLYLAIAVYNRDNGLWPFSISVSLMQRVVLERRPASGLFAATWSTDYLGSAGSTNIRSVRDNVKDQVDKFINAYLAVNPKK
jgi:hypothetical protein